MAINFAASMSEKLSKCNMLVSSYGDELAVEDDPKKKRGVLSGSGKMKSRRHINGKN